MCLYPYDDDGGGVNVDSGERRARKTHKCNECRRTIDPGETYRFWTDVGGDHGGFLTTKMCAHCWATIDAGAKMTGCAHYWIWEFVFDLVDDEMGFLADIRNNHTLTRRQEALVRLLAYRGGQRRWRTPDGDLYPIPVAVEPLANEAA